MDQASRMDKLYAWVRAKPFVFDALIAAVPSLLSVALWTPRFENRWLLVMTLMLIIPLAWRRSRPAASTAVIGITALGQLVAYDALLLANLSIPVSLYSVTAYGPRWASRIALILAFGGCLAAGPIYYGDSSDPTLLWPFVGFVSLLLVSTWALGTLRRLRLREQDRLLERARLLEQERAQEVQLAATAERARIAREMHDVIAHSLSVTVSQADGGRYAAHHDPEAAIAALETISVTGRQALNDMRALLGVLRQDDDRPLGPQPDTEVIPDLVDQIRTGGLDVTLEITGRAQKLPPGPGLAAYRIVQESLTNVLKHAGPASCAWVRLDWRKNGLEIEVTDDGRGAGAGLDGIITGNGQGIQGMTERAQLHGGQLTAGPQPGGGFTVRAQLPYRAVL